MKSFINLNYVLKIIFIFYFCIFKQGVYSTQILKGQSVLDFLNNLFDERNEFDYNNNNSNNNELDILKNNSNNDNYNINFFEHKTNKKINNEADTTFNNKPSGDVDNNNNSNGNDKTEKIPVEQISNDSNNNIKDSKAVSFDLTNNKKEKEEKFKNFFGWFKIASASFKNENKFPPIILPNLTSIKLKTDFNFFRINLAFNDSNLKNEIFPKNEKLFWFVLNKNALYYTMLKNDLNILGSIFIKEIKNLGDLNNLCFEITTANLDKWKICVEEEKDFKNLEQLSLNLSNLILANLKTEKEKETELYKKLNSLKMERTTQQKGKDNLNNCSNNNVAVNPLILIPLPSRVCNEHWNYENKGNDWECICKEGKKQSPINLPPRERTIVSPVTPIFNYDKVDLINKISTLDLEQIQNKKIKIKYFQNSIKILNNNFGKVITLDNTIYKAEEINFKIPSEHMIDNKRFDMEMQIIHYGVTKGDIAKQLTLSFLFSEKPGATNKLIDDIDFFNLPNYKDTEKELSTDLYIPDVLINNDNSSKSNRKIETNIDTNGSFDTFSFYTYEGSLTFPPCTERTIVIVAENPLKIGSTQLKLMKEALKKKSFSSMFDENNDFIPLVDEEIVSNVREIQDLNNREIHFYDYIKYGKGLF